jgi:histidinol dehydrogenase
MSETLLPERSIAEVLAGRRSLLDAATRGIAREILSRVEHEGELALLEFAQAHGDWNGREPWWFDRDACHEALAALDPGIRSDLEAMAGRIRAFALAQREAIHDVEMRVPGGSAGHTLVPVGRAGCYAPGGRFPLPSSVLMTVIPACVAGVRESWVATPHPSPTMLAAAALAGASGVLGIGGAQGIAALAFGVGPVPRCDVIVGPGNRYVTAAKEALAGHVGIDSLAGPSELVVVADASADAELIAADLIAQAEHDTDAMAVLVTTSRDLAGAVREELELQLRDLPTASIAAPSLASGGVLLVQDLDLACDAVNQLAPEHLEVLVADPEGFARGVVNAGAVFLGPRAAEVFGDYGAGPNHVLPTGGGARFAAGLSVFTFLRARTWLRLEDPVALVKETARLARIEGLEGHARAAERRGGEW